MLKGYDFGRRVCCAALALSAACLLGACAPHSVSGDQVGNHLGHYGHWLRAYGVTGVTIILTLESLGLPLPGELLLIFASIFARHGGISFPALIMFAWAGAVVGDNISYVIGRCIGRPVLLRNCHKIGLTAERLRAMEDIFARYGAVTVGFARFVNGLRQLNGLVAGVMKMEWWRFLSFNALGGALWVSVWGLSGFFLGDHISRILIFAHDLGIAGAVIAGAFLLIGIVYLLHRRARVAQTVNTRPAAEYNAGRLLKPESPCKRRPLWPSF